MAELTHNAEQEFWQPPAAMQMASPPQEVTPAPALSDACNRCDTEYLVGARFCHACGTPRVQPSQRQPYTENQSAYLSADFLSSDFFVKGAAKLRATAAGIRWRRVALPAWVQYLHFHQIKRWIGLPTPSLVAFFIGLGCIAGAIGVSLVYKPQNFVDFQAIQMWRIEWLLAATASFVAGILLKKPSTKDPDDQD
ncbi:MAG: hypothetical protein ABR921_01230 [Candidatus Sulfotelmatobacter sp.]|jgi:hypothetical protein